VIDKLIYTSYSRVELFKERNMIFYAYLDNRADQRDDDVLKIKAKDATEALSIARDYCKTSGRFELKRDGVYGVKKFRKYFSDWYLLLRTTEPYRL
jgi:hypothetical protein